MPAPTRVVDLELLGRRAAARRVELGWTQNDLARVSGLWGSQVSSFETGDRTPTIDNLVRLADALGVSLDWLTGRTGDDLLDGTGPAPRTAPTPPADPATGTFIPGAPVTPRSRRTPSHQIEQTAHLLVGSTPAPGGASHGHPRAGLLHPTRDAAHRLQPAGGSTISAP